MVLVAFCDVRSAALDFTIGIPVASLINFRILSNFNGIPDTKVTPSFVSNLAGNGSPCMFFEL